MKKLSDAVDKEVFKNIKVNTLKTKVTNLDQKIPEATNLVPISQHNTDKQNLERENWRC